MSSTIDGAGRVVIPKALRDRAGLTPGSALDFLFHDGVIEVRLAHGNDDDVEWEEHGGINWPVPRGGSMSPDEARQLLESVRDERVDQVLDGSR
ncbi:MAG: hypothetical protein RJB01_881 [Actinomycetota bacterium]